MESETVSKMKMPYSGQASSDSFSVKSVHSAADKPKVTTRAKGTSYRQRHMNMSIKKQIKHARAELAEQE